MNKIYIMLINEHQNNFIHLLEQQKKNLFYIYYLPYHYENSK